VPSFDLALRYPASGTLCRIRVARGGLSGLGPWTKRTTGAHRVAVVSDHHVSALFGESAVRGLRRSGIDAALVTVPAGERTKSVLHLERLWRQFSEIGLVRSDAIVAMGGGVVGDLAGFAAATWLRGVPWVNVPTSVVAQVDSAIGGKTAIDVAGGKNLAGSFHQPAGVLIDPDALVTLPDREFRAGLAEVVKTGMAVDAGLFRWLERHAGHVLAREPDALLEIVRRAVRAKSRVVIGDEREREAGGRTALNFGHTVGHGLESVFGLRRLRHGEAVAIGMHVAAILSASVAGLPLAEQERLDALLERLGLPIAIPPGVRVAVLGAAIRRDKKRDRSGTRWVLTPRVGHASVPRLISGRRVRAALCEAGAWA